MTFSNVLISSALFLLATVSEAWGPVGHECIGGLAQSLLSSTANEFVKRLLPDFSGSMAKAAPWADQIKSNSSWAWSYPLHYCDSTNDWECKYTASEHPDGIDVVGALGNYTKRLTSLDDSFEENVALKFIIHFMGDIHQPLHVGFASNKGGNKFEGEFFSYRDNLHAIWDSYIIYNIVDKEFSRDYSAFQNHLADLLNTTYASQKNLWMEQGKNAASFFADETAALACKYAYTDSKGVHIENGFNLGADYLNFTQNVVQEQLVKASARLAGLVESIVSQRSSRK